MLSAIRVKLQQKFKGKEPSTGWPSPSPAGALGSGISLSQTLEMQPVSPQQEHLSDAGKMEVIPPQRLQQVGKRRASIGFPVANTLNVMVTLSFGNVRLEPAEEITPLIWLSMCQQQFYNQATQVGVWKKGI